MKQLILIRHAKSSWDHKVSDEDRPLQERGTKDAHLVGSHLYLHLKGSQIDFAYSSPAIRALHTAMIVVRETEHPLDRFGLNASLYDFSGEKVSKFVGQLDDDLETVALFGHNNAFTFLANAWGDRYIENLPTAGVVHIVFQEERWSNISRGSIKKLLLPKQLRNK